MIGPQGEEHPAVTGGGARSTPFIRVRNYQTGYGLETVLDEGAGEGCGRVDVSHAGVECEADERVENGGVRAFLPAQRPIWCTSKCHRGQPRLSDDH